MTEPVRRFRLSTLRMPRLVAPAEPTPPGLRLRLRSKLVFAMTFAALVPVVLVASIATRVILSSLESGLREDADRQLTVGLNLILRAVERLGDETVQLSESSNLPAVLHEGPTAIGGWLASESTHVPSALLQLLDEHGAVVFQHVIGGADERFKDIGVQPGDAAVRAAQSWTRDVTLVGVGDRVVVRAVAPIVDSALALRGSCCRPHSTASSPTASRARCRPTCCSAARRVTCR